MRQIKINTNQNVGIEYEMASLRERIFAYLVDMLALAAFMVLAYFLSMMVLLLYSNYAEKSFEELSEGEILFFGPILLYIFYSLGSEILLGGQTLGKMVFKIRIIKLDGANPTANEYLIRWAFRMIDIFLSSGIIAVIFIQTSSYRQRIGDVLADTTLIRVIPQQSLRFRHLESMNKMNAQYQPQYPQIKEATESQIETIRAVITRFQKHPNRATVEVIELLIQEIESSFQISKGEKYSNIGFLETLVKDYGILKYSD